MKAYLFDSKSRKIHPAEVPLPEPKSAEVLIRIRAVSINAADYRSMKMGIVPKNGIYGSDISGEIVKAGNAVRTFKVGDVAVADLSGCGMGGFAEYVCVPETVLVRKPEGLTHQTAASLPMASVTALQALRKGKTEKDQKVLIYGASGGVGSFAIQLAKYLGAEVTGVCGANNIVPVKGLGADSVIDYAKQDVFGLEEKYDVILAIHGNNSLRRYAKLLNANGRLVVVGGELSQIFRTMLFGSFFSFWGKKMTVLSAKPDTADLKYVLELADTKKISAHVEKVYSFAELPAALEYAGTGHARGKLVVETDIS